MADLGVGKAVEISRETMREVLGMEIEDLAQAAASAVDEYANVRRYRKELEARLRDGGLSDAEVRQVRRRVFGELDGALKRLAKAIS